MCNGNKGLAEYIVPHAAVFKVYNQVESWLGNVPRTKAGYMMEEVKEIDP